MNVDTINPFLGALQHVLQTMAKIDAQPGKALIKQSNMAVETVAVTGYIGLVGDSLKGSLAISFTETAILDIATRVFGEPVEEVDNEVADLVGEVTNIITGNAKHALAHKGYKFHLSIPTVIVGVGHIVMHNSRGPIIAMPFDTGAGKVILEVCIK